MPKVYVAASGVPQKHIATHAIICPDLPVLDFLKFDKTSTVQREILKACTAAIKYILREKGRMYDTNITIFTNNSYILDMFNKGYLEKWKENDWIKTDGKSKITNIEEIVALDYAITNAKAIGFNVEFRRPDDQRDECYLEEAGNIALANRKKFFGC